MTKSDFSLTKNEDKKIPKDVSYENEIAPPTKDISLVMDLPKPAFGKLDNGWSLQNSRNSFRGGDTPNFNDSKNSQISSKNIFSLFSENKDV